MSSDNDDATGPRVSSNANGGATGGAATPVVLQKGLTSANLLAALRPAPAQPSSTPAANTGSGGSTQKPNK